MTHKPANNASPAASVLIFCMFLPPCRVALQRAPRSRDSALLSCLDRNEFRIGSRSERRAARDGALVEKRRLRLVRLRHRTARESWQLLIKIQAGWVTL